MARDFEAAIQKYVQAADLGHAPSATRLSELLLLTNTGVAASGVAIDADKARSYLIQSADSGVPESSFRLSLIELSEASDEDQESVLAALVRMQSAGDSGYAPAIIELAMHHQDILPEQEALKWLIAAAELDHVPAMLILADKLQQEDNAGAKMWYSRASELGAEEAFVHHARNLKYASSSQVSWYTKAIESLDAEDVVEAHYQLGMIYSRGTRHHSKGVQTDGDKAVMHLENAADAGDGRAHMRLGELLLSGSFVARDPEKAAVHVKTADEAGVEGADMLLALLYRYGTGVETNKEYAVALYHGLANEGDPYAMFSLGEMHENGEAAGGVPEAVRWYERAMSQRFGDAYYAMWRLHQQDLHRQRDVYAAENLLKSAASYGSAEANFYLGQRNESLPRAKLKDLRKARSYYNRATWFGHSDAYARVEALDRRIAKHPERIGEIRRGVRSAKFAQLERAGVCGKCSGRKTETSVTKVYDSLSHTLQATYSRSVPCSRCSGSGLSSR